MRFLLAIFSALLIVVATCNAAVDVKSAAKKVPNAAATNAKVNVTAPAVPVVAPVVLLKNPSQCLYDFRKQRVNTDCKVETPIKCLKGTLVETKNGEKHEMCCCNFSNVIEEKP
jgi:hypothetical protein